MSRVFKDYFLVALGLSVFNSHKGKDNSVEEKQNGAVVAPLRQLAVEAYFLEVERLVPPLAGSLPAILGFSLRGELGRDKLLPSG